MRASGQKFVKFCTLTHAAKLVVGPKDNTKLLYLHFKRNVKQIVHKCCCSIKLPPE